MKEEEEKDSAKLQSFAKIPVEQIVAAIRSVRYGQIEIVVQDSRVIQINKTEKVRFDQATDN